MILQFKGFEDFSLEDLSWILIDQFSHGTIVCKLSGYGLLFLIFHVSMINSPKLSRVCIFNTQKNTRSPSNLHSTPTVFFKFCWWHIKKRLGLYKIKSKIEKLSWSHLDICLNSKIEEFFHMSKMISKTRKICTSPPAVKVESKTWGNPVVVQSEPFLILPT